MKTYTVRLKIGDGTDPDGIEGHVDVVAHATDSDAAIDIVNRLFPQADSYEVMT